MGLFDKVKSFAQNLVGAKASSAISSTANKILTVITHPVASAVNFKKAQEKTSKESTVSLVGHGIINTLAVVAPFTSAGKTAVASIASSLVPKTALGTGTALIGGIVGANILTSSPTARESLVSAPSGLANLGQNIGKVIESPTIDNAKNTFA
ncbi:MAG: hypothetical protein AAB789_01950, partial [Patescibacteria group bacterium]